MGNELRRANIDATKANKVVQLRDCHFLALFVASGDREWAGFEMYFTVELTELSIRVN